MTSSSQSDHFSIHQLGDGIYAAIATPGGSAISNAGIIDLGGRTLVFDTFLTPQAGRDLRLTAQQLTGRDPDLVVNSHYHNDHIWGNQVFSPQTLFVSTTATRTLMGTAGADELQWAREVSAPRLAAARRQLETAQDDFDRQEARQWIGYFGGLVEALPRLEIRFPEITFAESLTIQGSVRAVELQSYKDCHTGSDTILRVGDSDAVFMADLLFVDCHPYLDEADVSCLRRALQQIPGAGARVYVPGHGPLGTTTDVDSNIEYIDMCVAAANRLAAEGDISPERIARETAPAPFAKWGLSRFFAANLDSLCSKITSRRLNS